LIKGCVAPRCWMREASFFSSGLCTKKKDADLGGPRLRLIVARLGGRRLGDDLSGLHQHGSGDGCEQDERGGD